MDEVQVEVPVELVGRKEPGALKNFLAGGVGGICVVLSCHPLDTIKVRLQTQAKPAPGEKPMFTGTVDCAYKTVKNEGFRGIYRGMLAPLLALTPLNAVGFFGYGLGKQLQQRTPTEILTIEQHFKAGLLSGMCATVITAPGERIKCLMQIQQASRGKARYSSSIDCAKQLYREGGIRHVYRGTMATLLRDVPAFGIFFSVYEFLLRYLTPKGKSHQELSPGRVMFSGGMAGLALWTYSIVPDTLKSRYQTAPSGMYNGIRDVFRELVRTEGPRALFRGMTPLLLRAFPANAMCLLGYEVTIRALNWLLPDW